MNSADFEACVFPSLLPLLPFPHCLLQGGVGGASGSLLAGGRAQVHLFAQDLCERHEKGVLHKHQRALHKYSLMKRQMMSAAVQSREPDSVEQLESRIVEVVLASGEGGMGGLGCL